MFEWVQFRIYVYGILVIDGTYAPECTTMAASMYMYVILVFCACVLVGVSANDECSEPDVRRGRIFCAVVARDSLCQNGTVSNETCQNCTQLESNCGPLLLTNETEFCEQIDEELIQFCPIFRVVNCTGDPASRTDDQQRICDYCLVIEREECSAPPPSVCSEYEAQLACSAVERLEDSYTCTELFPSEEDDEGPCLICDYYELFCGRPLGELNTTRLCGDDDMVLYCYIISIREECEDNLDPEEALKCAYCSFVSEANCTLPPPTGDDETCNETELESFCATALGEGLCPGTTFAEETCENCLIFELLCGPPQLTNETEFCEQIDEELIQFCPIFRVMNCTGDPASRTDDQQRICDYCLLIEREECSAPPPSVCSEYEAQLACSAVEQLEDRYTCTELFPPEEDDEGPCLICDYYELFCGRPLGELNTTRLCGDDDMVLYCYIISMREECEDNLDPEVALKCAYCSFVSEANCTLPPPTGDDETCNETELESFCATALGEGLCPGTTFAEETCENCLIFELLCGPPQGDITDLCNNTEAEEECSEALPICSMEDIPDDNITLCDACHLRGQRCEAKCFNFELQLFCTLLETPKFQDGECIELFPQEAEACTFCEDFQDTCGHPP